MKVEGSNETDQGGEDEDETENGDRLKEEIVDHELMKNDLNEVPEGDEVSDTFDFPYNNFGNGLDQSWDGLVDNIVKKNVDGKLFFVIFIGR